MAPPEICPEHDLIIDQYGCWVCGHAGPISGEAFPSWYRWSMERTTELLSRVRTRSAQAPHA